jgi:DNA polymerase III delta prime subunit
MHTSERQNIPLLALVGPTAAGKTALAVALARRLDGEIVSADSRQVYRSMDIGTAKPTPAERAAAPHHLIDVVDPDADFSLGLYQDLAFAAIAGIVARGKLPLLVGGTGQYLAAVLQGWEVTPSRPEAQNEASRYLSTLVPSGRVNAAEGAPKSRNSSSGNRIVGAEKAGIRHIFRNSVQICWSSMLLRPPERTALGLSLRPVLWAAIGPASIVLFICSAARSYGGRLARGRRVGR